VSDATVFVSLAFAIVWMKRKQRWKLFFQALEGKVKLPDNPITASAGSTGSVSPTGVPSTSGGFTQTPTIQPPVTGGQAAN